MPGSRADAALSRRRNGMPSLTWTCLLLTLVHGLALPTQAGGPPLPILDILLLEGDTSLPGGLLLDFGDFAVNNSGTYFAEVVDENMANAARVHAVENGEDLGSYTMIAFGGAAPIHAGRLADKLGVKRILVPPGAGVGSAIGFLRAPFSFEANRSVYMKLSDFDGDRIKSLLSDLKAEATGFVRTCDEVSPILSEFKVYMRYTGQGWEIPIELTEDQAMNPDVDTFEARFIEDYTKLFGRPVAGMDIEITVWSVNATTPPETVARMDETIGETAASCVGARQLFDAAAGEFLNASVVNRFDMSSGERAAGPVAIVEDETTIIVPASRDAIRQPDGCIDIIIKGADQ